MPDLTLDDAVAGLRERLGDDLTETEDNRGQLIVRVAPEHRIDALRALKDLGFRFYSFCAGVDWPEEQRIEVMDHVYDHRTRRRVTVKCSVPRDAPRVPSAAGVYAGADWHERETWELYGVVFTGHPRLIRLLLPDWQEGYPMRKDFVLAPRVSKPWPGEFFEG